MTRISIEHLNKNYGQTRALQDVSLTLEPERLYGLLGRNGAGKTTLLNILTDRIFRTSGQVLVDGQDVTGNAAAQAKLYAMSEKTLYPADMRVRDLMRWTAEFYPDFDMGYAKELTEKFGLNSAARCKGLSTGYGSILKLILALSSGAEVLLLDEPVLGLDAGHRELFYREVIARYSAKPCTMVLSTHLIDEVADIIEEAVILKEGRIVRQQSVEELLQGAYTVSGPAEAVDRFAQGKPVLQTETLGAFKAATIGQRPLEAEQAAAREQGLEIGKPRLQKLFLDLTN